MNCSLIKLSLGRSAVDPLSCSYVASARGAPLHDRKPSTSTARVSLSSFPKSCIESSPSKAAQSNKYLHRAQEQHSSLKRQRDYKSGRSAASWWGFQATKVCSVALERHGSDSLHRCFRTSGRGGSLRYLLYKFKSRIN